MTAEPDDLDALDELAQLLHQRFPGLQLTPLPDLPADGGIHDGHQLPEDYKAWLRRYGAGPLGDSGLVIYAGPQYGRNVIPDHQRQGLSDVIIVAGDGEHHFVLYNSRFRPWYIHVVVGDLALMSALEPRMTFTGYLRYLCRDTPNPSPADQRSWEGMSLALMLYLIIGGTLMFLLAIVAYAVA
ncbi:MAG: SMI1/KNR4 family protein [Planctomycetota bacterium]|nr:MAG: SMI1/KNR4 family protein [Planctomycetota bacterium]